MKKRLLSILLVGALSFSLCACGNTDTQQTAQMGESTDQQATPETEAPHKHVYTEKVTVEATCEGDGLKTFTCECGDSYTDVIKATGHAFDYVYNEDATYYADGTETAECAVCGVTDTRTAEGTMLTYTYTDMTATMYAKQTVNVRDLPSTDGERVGGLSTNQEIAVTGQCNETAWYRIEYDGGTAYVSNSYLSDTKVEVSAPAQSSSGSSSSSGDGMPPYEFFTWYDMGDWMFYITDERSHHPSTYDRTNYWNNVAIMQERYPDMKIADGQGHALKDGVHWCFYICTQDASNNSPQAMSEFWRTYRKNY